MAQEDKTLLDEVIRSVDRRLTWEAIPATDGGLRVTLRHSHGEASLEVSDSELSSAIEEGGIPRNSLRERIRKTRRRIFRPSKPYMPWRLPNFEPIGAPGPRGGGWGGGGGGGGGRGRR